MKRARRRSARLRGEHAPECGESEWLYSVDESTEDSGPLRSTRWSSEDEGDPEDITLLFDIKSVNRARDEVDGQVRKTRALRVSHSSLEDDLEDPELRQIVRNVAEDVRFLGKSWPSGRQLMGVVEGVLKGIGHNSPQQS